MCSTSSTSCGFHVSAGKHAYGSYYTNTRWRKHSIVSQSNEVGVSYHMEKEGLSRVLDFLQKERKFHVEVLVTDRHCQINKWLREEHGEITHYYDVWHVAKGNAE